MQEESRPSGAKDTSSFNKRFRQSIIKLTIIYAVIIASILFISSSVLFAVFSKRLEQRFRVPVITENGTITSGIIKIDAPRPGFPSPDEVRSDLVDLLMLVNGFLLVVAGTLSYKLAEWTMTPLKKTYERERRFLSDASHELRTPLSILKMETENELLNTKLSANEKAKRESNLEEINRMSNLVSDLLTLSRLAENEVAAMRKPVAINLSAVITKSVDRLQKLADEHNVAVTTSLPGEIVTIESDTTLLDTILSNAIKNAIIYNKPEGSVTIYLSHNETSVEIAIADTGIGMSPEDTERIFERFYRTDKSRSRKTGGSGLGLSIVRSAVEALGGSVSLDSEINKGTTLTYTLPKKASKSV
jgi:signal transduction histidine kinase